MRPSAAASARLRGGFVWMAILAGALAAPAGRVRADVRPAVDVFLLGRPRAAAAGRCYSGTFEFRGGDRVVVDSLRLTGRGWRVLRFRPPASLTVTTATRTRIAFRARPADPAAPLVLEYRADGLRWRKSFDLSPAAVARARGPGSVTSRPNP